MKAPYEVIKVPHLTEKIGHQQELLNKVAFKVHPDVNKTEIKKAVEELFAVKVASVRVMNVLGKVKRVRVKAGRRASWKKAIVTLKPGSKIDFFEGK